MFQVYEYHNLSFLAEKFGVIRPPDFDMVNVDLKVIFDFDMWKIGLKYLCFDSKQSER